MPLDGNKSQSELNRTLRELIARQTAIDKRVERLETLESANIETVWNILEDTNWIEFNGLDWDDGIGPTKMVASDAALRSLPCSQAPYLKGLVTWEYWIRPYAYRGTIWGHADPPDWGAHNRAYINTPANTLRFHQNGGKAPTEGTTVLTLNVWQHHAFVYDDVTLRKGRIFINGVEETYSTQDAAVGNILGSATSEFLLGVDKKATSRDNAFGTYGWFRISDNLRYTTNFTPPSRCALPAIDGNTIGQWIGTEADPIVTIDNQEGTAALDGTPTNCVWGQCV
jgi:hypothetical protein